MDNKLSKDLLIESHIKNTNKWKKLSARFLFFKRVIYLGSFIGFCWVLLSLSTQLGSVDNKYLGYLFVFGITSAIFTFISKAIDKSSCIVSISLTNEINKLENTPLSSLAIERTRDAVNYIYAMLSLVTAMIAMLIPFIILLLKKDYLTGNISTAFFVLSLSFIIFAVIKYIQYAYSTRSINKDISHSLNEHYKKNKKDDAGDK